ncbi:hypothetical protein BC936DRAFT_143847 [Jimgerdemannia flammicorona]|uniref:mRNA capping enzyme adenylation domain-containing protein n=1 Tax=Jimgerdemannia flammicorona TaxID=994334 RepID=A0A432ZYY4_9FUNG|nr:hypothetical protein BC936DRAFT_143847 [Jimgerdemannia flammicorona]
MVQTNPRIARVQPFSVEFKKQEFAYHLETVFQHVIPNLKHGNDGLIFTSAVAPYIMGTLGVEIGWTWTLDMSYVTRVELGRLISLQRGVNRGRVKDDDLRAGQRPELKWKPAEENSIDFQLSLDYPPAGTIPGVKDTSGKPRFVLLQWMGKVDGKETYERFGEMGVTDEEWKRWVLCRAGLYGMEVREIASRICN